MTPVPAEPTVQKWTRVHWLAAVAIVFALHITLIYIFGARKPITPVPVKNVPSMALTGDLPGLNGTLFALPDRYGFSGLMWATPPLSFHQQDWTEAPHWLVNNSPLVINELGGAFRHYIQTNRFAKTTFEFNQSPPLTVPVIKPPPILARESTLQVAGDVANRPLLTAVKLPSWPSSDIIAPSVVQVLVDAAGSVVSATLLPPVNSWEPSAVRDTVEPFPARDAEADGRAVDIARNTRFAPLTRHGENLGSQPLGHLAVGQLIFNWQVVPVTSTNAL